jgi:hypothetical protein
LTRCGHAVERLEQNVVPFMKGFYVERRLRHSAQLGRVNDAGSGVRPRSRSRLKLRSGALSALAGMSPSDQRSEVARSWVYERDCAALCTRRLAKAIHPNPGGPASNVSIEANFEVSVAKVVLGLGGERSSDPPPTLRAVELFTPLGEEGGALP